MLKQVFMVCLVLVLTASYLFAQHNALPADKKTQALLNKFSEKDPYINAEAINALARMGEPAVKYLTGSLQHENENVRWCSAITLEKIAPAGRSAIPYLIKALNDSSANVRWCAALALGKYKSAATLAGKDLQNLLCDQDHDVRWAAYVALSQIDHSMINRAPEFSDVIHKLDKLTPRLMAELKVPGVALTVIGNNKIQWSKGYGFADVARQIQVDSATVFEACSMSKPVFAYLVLKLVDQDKLDLDKPLCNYLDDELIGAESDYARQVTARMVLAHTSGMPNWRKGDEERGGPLPVYFKPGIKFSYSGEGFYYLQRVVERICAESLEELSRSTLFNKLDLRSSSYVWTEKIKPQLAAGYDSSGQGLERSKYLHANAAYTLYTTAGEYARLMLQILGPDDQHENPISAKMKKEMLAHQVRVDTREVIDRPGRFLGLCAYRGMGWAIDSTISHDVIYHSGSNQTGFRCYAQYSQTDGSGIVIMTNGANGNELWRRLISEIGDW